MVMTPSRVSAPWEADPFDELVDLRIDAGGGRWTEAACRGMDSGVFFPERGAPTAPAKAVCRGCPVRAACLREALVGRERFGVWGGFSERERRLLRRRVHRGAPVEAVIVDAIRRGRAA